MFPITQLAHFARYAESIPDGETSTALSEAARKNNVYVIGGTIPERNNDKLYNTCTVWGPDGKLVVVHRKVIKIDVVHYILDTYTENIKMFCKCACAYECERWFSLKYFNIRARARACVCVCVCVCVHNICIYNTYIFLQGYISCISLFQKYTYILYILNISIYFQLLI